MKIIFEDEYFLAVDKPSGLVVHGDGRTDERSLVDWVGEYFENKGGGLTSAQADIGNPHTLDSGRYTKRYGIVNRLDRETSGLILIAKDQETFSYLQKQFSERIIKKEYLALVWGEVDVANLLATEKILPTEKKNLYKILEPISRHKKDPRIWVCGSGVGERASKRDAETILLQGHTTQAVSSGKTSLLTLFPKTGRTHQLRLHMRFLGHPIVGDKKYGIASLTNEHGTGQIEKVLQKIGSAELEMEKDSRLMLHAKSLEFLHPVTNKIIKIESEIPPDFL